MCSGASIHDVFDDRKAAQEAPQMYSSNNKKYAVGQLSRETRPHLDTIMSALVDTAQDPLFALSVPEYKVAWFNQATADYFSQHHGVQIALGMTPDELAENSQRAEIFKTYLATACNAGDFERTLQLPGDNNVWRMRFRAIVDNNQCVGVAVSANDISALDEARARLADSEEMYRSLFESMGEGAVFQDSNGRVIGANRAAEQIEGRTSSQMLGLTSDSTDWGAVHEDGSSFPGEEHPSMVTLRTEQPQSEVIMGIRRPSGEQRWISINSMPVALSSRAGSKAVVTTFHDITKQRSLEEQLKERVRQLDIALEQTLAAMSDMTEMRDPYTAGHERTVAKIAVAIGETLGWDTERCATLKCAALVHDIGKIAIPAEILVKPSRLSETEYQLIKTHVDLGYRILLNVKFAKPIAEIVRQHHERMDGSGYPLGLIGDQILPESRVVAVADVVDSMMSHRPYRAALGIKVAMQELEKNVGHLYDEQVVEAVRYLDAQNFFD